MACPDCPLTENSLKEVCRGLSDLSTMSNRCTLIEVQLWEMVDNSSSLCTSPLGWFFRQWAVRTDHFTLQ